MSRRLPWLLTAVLLCGCGAHRSLTIPYDDQTHRDAADEWASHDRGNEWW